MPTWSMVWLAPVPRSSGGRSAERSSRGTADIEASTTAGSQLATAVPEVHTSGDRAAGGPGQAHGVEGGGALVEVDVDPEAAVPREGEGQRGGARTR